MCLIFKQILNLYCFALIKATGFQLTNPCIILFIYLSFKFYIIFNKINKLKKNINLEDYL